MLRPCNARCVSFRTLSLLQGTRAPSLRGMASCGSMTARGGGACGINEGQVGGMVMRGSGSSSMGDSLRCGRMRRM